MATYLETPADLDWLRDAHGIALATTFKAAILYGNEDYPCRVELYMTNDYRETPVTYERDANGDWTYHTRPH